PQGTVAAPGLPGANAILAHGTEENDMASPARSPETTFLVHIDAGTDEIRIRYELVNTGEEPLWVFNRMPGIFGGTDLTPDLAAVAVENGGDGLVEISQRAFAPPAGLLLEIPDQFVAQPLGSGERLEESLRVALPLQRRRPYAEHEPVGLPDPVTAVRYCIGLVAAGSVPSPYQREGLPVLYHDDLTAAAQTLLCSEAVPLANPATTSATP